MDPNKHIKGKFVGLICVGTFILALSGLVLSTNDRHTSRFLLAKGRSSTAHVHKRPTSPEPANKGKGETVTKTEWIKMETVQKQGRSKQTEHPTPTAEHQRKMVQDGVMHAQERTIAEIGRITMGLPEEDSNLYVKGLTAGRKKLKGKEDDPFFSEARIEELNGFCE